MGNNNINAGSGGASSCSTNTSTDAAIGTCTSGYDKPAWQVGTGVPDSTTDPVNGGFRDVPDISLMSGAGGDNASWVVCTDDVDPASNQTANCTYLSDGTTFYFLPFGGTSTAAPAFAGILAMAQQYNNKGRLGQAARQLYDLYNGPAGGSIFHDITVGNNSVYCASGSPDCDPTNFFLTGYDATTGYDLATGLGSVDVSQLVANWGMAESSVTVTVTPASSTVDTIHSLGVSVSVVDPSGLGTTPPTGSVTISGGGYVSPQPATTLDGSGNASFTIPAGALKAGTDILTVVYNGDTTDTTYSVATGTATVTVTKIASSLTVTPASASIPPSASLVVTGTVSGGGPSKPTGTVTLTSGSYTSAATTLSGGNYSITILPNSLAPGTDTLTANYSGDSIYSTSSGTGSVNVPGFTLSATPLSFTAGAATGNASTVTVTPVGGYTGTITLTAAVTSAPAGAVSAPTFTGSTVAITNASAQTGTITVATTPIPAYVRAPGSIAWFKAAGGTTILGLLFFCLPLGTRRGRKIVSFLALVVAAAFTITGCGISVTPGGGGGGGKTTPSVTVSPAKGAIATTDTLSVAVSISGATTAATGTITLKSGTYTSSATALASGSATVVIPAGSLAAGSDTLTATYSGDTNYNSGSGSAPVTVSKNTPAVTVSPAKSAIAHTDSVSVAISVSGGTSTPNATGTVTLSGGGYTSAATALANGTATIVIPASSLALGSQTLTANYSGDSNYSTASGTAPLTVAVPGTTPGSYTVTVTGKGNDAAATTFTTTFTMTVN